MLSVESAPGDGRIHTVPASGEGTPTELYNTDDRAYPQSLHWAAAARLPPESPSTAPAIGSRNLASRTDDTEPAVRASVTGVENRLRSLEDIKRDFLLEGLGDAVGLWEFGGRVRRVLGTEEDEEVKNAALGLLREMVGEGLFVPELPASEEEGYFRPPGPSAPRSP